MTLNGRNSARDAFFSVATGGVHCFDVLVHIRKLPMGENRRFLWQAYRRLHAALRVDNRDATEAWAHVLAIGIKAAAFLVPLATHGQQMRKGRKIGAAGPMRRAIQAALKQMPRDARRNIPPRELWEIMRTDKALCSRHDLDFGDDEVWAGNHNHVGRPRFANILLEVRRPAKKSTD